MGIQEMDRLQVNKGNRSDRIQKKVIGSSDYTSSQICICDACGSKIVSSNGSCEQACGRCGTQMREHTGVQRVDTPNVDAYGH
jgi:hypothetical protein